MTEGGRQYNGLASPSGNGTQVSKLQQDGLEHVPVGGSGHRQSTETIWSPYGPYSQSKTGPFSHLPTAQPPTLILEDPKREAVAPWWLVGDRAAGTWTLSMHHLAQLSLGNPKLEKGDKVILGCKDQSHRVSRGIWVTEMAALEACRISHRCLAPQHFCGAHL